MKGYRIECIPYRHSSGPNPLMWSQKGIMFDYSYLETSKEDLLNHIDLHYYCLAPENNFLLGFGSFPQIRTEISRVNGSPHDHCDKNEYKVSGPRSKIYTWITP